jgi:hypothetical protein
VHVKQETNVTLYILRREKEKGGRALHKNNSCTPQKGGMSKSWRITITKSPGKN